MSDIQKTILTFLAAIFAPFVIAIFIFIATKNTLLFLLTWSTLIGYILIAGFQKNGPLEKSIGGIFNQMTSWTIPPGISWWVPKPFGQALLRRSIDRRLTTLDYTDVQTKDGSQVGVSAICTWYISDIHVAARFSEENLQKEVEALVDRNIRWFALKWDSDEDHDEKEDTALSAKKASFSRYIAGSTSETGRDGITTIKNTTNEDLKKIGVKFVSAKVTDVNPPEEVVQAREKAAAENAEAVAEKRNVEALVEQTKTLQSETGVSPEQALLAAQIARKDVKGIFVGGDAGDFTKGAALNSSKGGK